MCLRDIYEFLAVSARKESPWGQTSMWGQLTAFAKCQSGATSIEYGLISAGVAVAVIAVVNGLGTNLNTKFSTLKTALK